MNNSKSEQKIGMPPLSKAKSLLNHAKKKAKVNFEDMFTQDVQRIDELKKASESINIVTAALPKAEPLKQMEKQKSPPKSPKTPKRNKASS